MSITATLVIQIIVFLLLALFTMKFVWPPITAALDERARKVAEGLSAADKARSELGYLPRPIEPTLRETLAYLRNAEHNDAMFDVGKRALGTAAH